MSGPTHTISSACDTDGNGCINITFHDLRRSTVKNAEALLNNEIAKLRKDHVPGEIKTTLVRGHKSGAEWIYQLRPAIHPEQALFQAGASEGHCYEIVGASYTPAGADGTREMATIDLSTPDHTGGLLKHDYGTGETTLKWDGEDNLFGTEDDVRTAVDDITRGRLDPQELFASFQEQMAGSGTNR